MTTVVDYGTDLWLQGSPPDLSPSLGLVTGRTCLTQALLRRIQSPRGCLFYDLEYGIDIRGWVDGSVKGGNVARKAARLDREYVKDTRVLSSSTTGAFSGGILTFTSVIVDGVGPFPFVLAVSSVSVQLLTFAQ